MSFDIGYETEMAVLGWVFEIISGCVKKEGYLDPKVVQTMGADQSARKKYAVQGFDHPFILLLLLAWKSLKPISIT